MREKTTSRILYNFNCIRCSAFLLWILLEINLLKMDFNWKKNTYILKICYFQMRIFNDPKTQTWSEQSKYLQSFT